MGIIIYGNVSIQGIIKWENDSHEKCASAIYNHLLTVNWDLNNLLSLE